MLASGPERLAKQRIALGAVRLLVLTPIVFAMPLPLMLLVGSWLPLYAGIIAAGVMAASGTIETTRGVLQLRAARRAELAVPEARLIEKK